MTGVVTTAAIIEPMMGMKPRATLIANVIRTTTSMIPKTRHQFPSTRFELRDRDSVIPLPSIRIVWRMKG